MNKFYLSPVDNKKSFYNKAHVVLNNDIATLYSYNTEIMSYNTKTKEVLKTPYYDYSATTKRHQKAFCALYNIA